MTIDVALPTAALDRAHVHDHGFTRTSVQGEALPALEPGALGGQHRGARYFGNPRRTNLDGDVQFLAKELNGMGIEVRPIDAELQGDANRLVYEGSRFGGHDLDEGTRLRTRFFGPRRKREAHHEYEQAECPHQSRSTRAEAARR